MTNTVNLEQAARYTVDEYGNPVVQIPVSLWHEILGEFGVPSQYESMKALFEEWAKRPPEEKPSDEWWDEFDQFLRDNRLNFQERDLGLE